MQTHAPAAKPEAPICQIFEDEERSWDCQRLQGHPAERHVRASLPAVMQWLQRTQVSLMSLEALGVTSDVAQTNQRLHSSRICSEVIQGLYLVAALDLKCESLLAAVLSYPFRINQHGNSAIYRRYGKKAAPT